MSKERKIKRAKEIDILLKPFYDSCKNKGLCVHECQFFDERHWNNGIHVKSWAGQRASINPRTKKVTFRDFDTWKFNFHVDNNKGCLSCNNHYKLEEERNGIAE